MTVRLARSGDKDNLKALFCAYYGELDCDEDAAELFDCCLYKDMQLNLLSVAVAVDEGLCGFAVFQIDDPINDWCFKEGVGDVREIFVLPSYRGKGVGGELLRFCKNSLKAAGAERCYCLPTDQTRKFFEKFGFVDAGEYCAELDEIVLEANL